MGVIPTKKSLVLTEKLAASAFCRRRLSVVMMRLKMAETMKEAVTFIEQVAVGSRGAREKGGIYIEMRSNTAAQGHVRVGTETVTNPAFHVTKNMEDFVTWVDTSKIKRKVLM